ncbi:MAG: hypothetical protein DWQ04_17935 [Chloroflexi bacterium]|nr:MAG: hypothetical protein DWQ04_17935 [Chloroflexota bacterium]
MPTTRVAKMYCVSDKAVEKRCKKFGIRKPPPGYWAKMQWGKIAPEMEYELRNGNTPRTKQE